MDNQRAVVQALLDYYAAFNSPDPQASLPFFHEPTVLIGPQGAFAAPTHDILTPLMATAIDSLRARGFGWSELSVRRVEALSASTNLVAGVAVRYKADGQELERVGVTYVLPRTDMRWRIAVLIVHDPDEVERTDEEAQATVPDVKEAAGVERRGEPGDGCTLHREMRDVNASMRNIDCVSALSACSA
jgi:ketosteroid isomerase-like protein